MKNNHPIIEKTMNKLEDALSEAIKDTGIEAPVLEASMKLESHKWYRIFLADGLSGDGSDYYIYIKKGSKPKTGPLCLFFSGGGIAYDVKTAKSPATAGRIFTGHGGYYWNNLRPVTQLMNIGAGITDLNRKRNPFYDWNFIIITYSTGDFHVGDSTYSFTDINGRETTLYFHGYKNFTEAIKVSKEYFPGPKRLLIAGDSAGGFAVLAHAAKICRDWYDKCSKITVFSDSAFMEKDDWSQTIKDLWKAPDTIPHDFTGNNLAVEWYKSLYEALGNKVRYLFACSPRDYLLSSFRNEIKTGEFTTGPDIQNEYRKAVKKMLNDFKTINPDTGVFAYNWRNMIYPGGGTVHTAVRTPFFYVPPKNRPPLSKWLEENLI